MTRFAFAAGAAMLLVGTGLVFRAFDPDSALGERRAAPVCDHDGAGGGKCISPLPGIPLATNLAAVYILDV